MECWTAHACHIHFGLSTSSVSLIYISFWLIYNTAEAGADPGEGDGEEDETVAGDEGDINDNGHDESDDHSDDNDDDGSDKDDDDEDDNNGPVSVLADVSLMKTIGTYFCKLYFSKSALIYIIM